MAKYDFLIVGAGLFGATCARLLTDKGYKCLVMDRHEKVGGFAATEKYKNIDIHLYGPHVFHTDSDVVWNFVTKYGKFNRYTHQPLAMSGDKLYHLPINMNTMYELFGTQFPSEAYKKIKKETANYHIEKPENLEEQGINNYGFTIFNKLIKGYTEKLWGKPCGELNTDILSNLLLTYTWNNNYYDTKYQGVPEEGYTKLVENILGDDVDVLLKKDFLSDRDVYMNLGQIIIYSGPIDEFCNYIYGPLEWRTLKFEIKDESASTNNMLGTSVINLTDKENNMLQMVEHKWFTPERINDETFANNTVVSYVYPDKWDPDKEGLYPVNNIKSEDLYLKYKHFTENNFPNVLFGGRSGIYRPLSMDQTIEIAIGLCNEL